MIQLKLFLLSLLILPIWFGACKSSSRVPEEIQPQLVKYFEEHPKELIGTTVFEPVIVGKDSGNYKFLLNLYIRKDLIRLSKTELSPAKDTIYFFDVTGKGGAWLVDKVRGKNGIPVVVVKTHDKKVDPVNEMMYSPDKTEAAARFSLSVHGLTPFGEGVMDTSHKIHLIGLFKKVEDKWHFERVEIDPDRIFDRK